MTRDLAKLALLATLILVASGCTEVQDESPVSTPATYGYVGSETCRNCHFEGARDEIPGQDAYANWAASGHRHILVAVDGEAPSGEFPDFAAFPNDVVEPPLGLTWDQVSYVVGGFHWKLRFIMDDGYIATGEAGETTQYNFATDEWVGYHDGEGQKKYDCGRCHSTGWVASDDGSPDNNKDGLEGLVGWFFAGGVHCEACHGPGGLHAESPGSFPMAVDYSSELCGRCHSSGDPSRIEASGGFVHHESQYDEWRHSPHMLGDVSCSDCHDPHASTVYDAEAPGEGVRYADRNGRDLEDNCLHCHGPGGDATQITFTAHNGIPDCVDCHMPNATRSATAAHSFAGDVATHIWAIRTDPIGKDGGMLDEGGMGDGGSVLLDEEGQARVSLDFVCYSCHEDPLTGEGGSAFPLDLVTLSNRADGIHSE